MTVNWDVKIGLRDVIQIIVLVVALVIAWQKLDTRLTLVEQRQSDTHRLLEQVSASMDQVQQYLSSRDPEFWWRSKSRNAP